MEVVKILTNVMIQVMFHAPGHAEETATAQSNNSQGTRYMVLSERKILKNYSQNGLVIEDYATASMYNIFLYFFFTSIYY
jgi:hypothetical protein